MNLKIAGRIVFAVFCILATLTLSLAPGLNTQAATSTGSSSGTFTAKAIDGVTYTHDNKYKDCTIRYGIDVSKWQGTIDWEKVKEAGVEFAIIRVGYRQSSPTGKGLLVEDTKFETYLADAKKAGIKVGVYLYSQALNEKEAIEEAQFMLDKLDGADLDLPVVMDLELNSDQRLSNADLSATELMANWIAFRNTVEDAGYTAMFYCYPFVYYGSMRISEFGTEIASNHRLWMASYQTEFHDSNDRWKWPDDYEVTIWQCTSSAHFDGIQSTRVDLDIWYDDGTDFGNTKKLDTGEKTSSILGSESYLVAAPYIKIYTEPDDTLAPAGLMTQGTHISIYDVCTDTNGDVWGKTIYNRQIIWVPLGQCIRE